MEENKKQILMKNNKLIKTKYTLNPVENKVFQFLLFEFQKCSDETMIAFIHKDKFDEIIKRDSNKTVKGISDILIKLRKTDIWIFEGKKWDNYGLIAKFGYDEETNIFNVKIFKEVYDLLTNYLNGYTPINLEKFFEFKSFYSQRFYELLRLWSNTKNVINYSLEELKELLMLENKYPIYRDFKKRVLEPVMKELNKKDLMKIEIKEHRTKRKVISIDFIVTDLDKRTYFGDNKKYQDHEKQQKKNYNEKTKKLKFKNFDERTYDYDDLEQKLLGWK